MMEKDKVTDLIASFASETGENAEETRKALLSMLEDLNDTNERLGKAKNEWEATFDSITDPIFIHDEHYRVVRCNRAYSALAGQDYKDIIGKPYYEVFPPGKGPLEVCLRAAEAAKEAKTRKEAEEEITYLGRVFKVRVYASVSDGEAAASYVHIMDDITEAKRAEQEIRMKALLLDAALDSIYVFDPDGRFVYVNRSAYLTRGYTEKELMSLSLRELNTPAHVKLIEPRMKALHEKGEISFETEHVCKGGSVMPVEISAKLIDYGGKKLIFAVARDITERKLVAEKLSREVEITRHLLMIAEASALTSDINRLLTQVVECVRKIVGCDTVLAYLWDAHSKSFMPVCGSGLEHRQVPLFMAGHLELAVPFVKKAFDNKKTLMSKYADTGRAAALFGWMGAQGTLSVIPLAGKTQYLGMLLSFCKATNPRAAGAGANRDAELMDGIAHQVSSALDEARLYKESIDKTMELSRKVETIQAMHEIDKQILSSLNPQEVIDTAIMLISRVMPCERATMALVDENKTGFVYSGGFGITNLNKGGRVPFEDSNTTDVINTGQPQYVANLGAIGDLLPFEQKLLAEGFLSHIRVPVAVRNEIIGVMSLGAKRPAAFTPEDLATLEKLAAQLGVALENARLVEDLEELYLGVVRTLSRAIDAKSPWTQGHSERVTAIALKIAVELGFSGKELRNLEVAGLLHDIGKLGTYEAILDKPGKLTDEELHVMRQHPLKGAMILEPIKKLNDIVPGIRHHHEYYDGTGYPDGIKGDGIPLQARILTVADTVDAMGADRPYRKGRSMDFIVAELKRCSGTQFDPFIVETYLKILEREGVIALTGLGAGPSI